MKTFRYLLFFTSCIIGYSQSSQPTLDLVGRWISVEIEAKDREEAGAGWVVSFSADGTFKEEIDEGFGVVEVWNGTYKLEGNNLSMHRTGFKEAWDFSVRQKKTGLSISRKRRGEEEYTALLKRSEEEHPALAKLPRWPKTKAEAVVLLKQKMKKEDLAELAATSKNQLIGKYHFGLGTYIRNAFGVWRGNKDLWNDITGGKSMHPDDLSSVIIEALWEDLQKK